MNAGRFADSYVRIGGKLAFAPLAVLIYANIAVIGGLIAEAQRTPIDVFLFHG